MCEACRFPRLCQKLLFIVHLFCFSHGGGGGGDMVSCYGCGLYFPDNKWCGTPPHLLIGLWDIFLGERAIHILCPFKNQIVILLLKEFFLYFGHKSLITSMICNRCLFWAILFFLTFLTMPFEAQIFVVLVKFDVSVFVTNCFCVISKKLFPTPGSFDQYKC